MSALRQIQTSLAGAVVKVPKFNQTIYILKYLRRLKINENTEYKILSRLRFLILLWYDSISL